MKKEYKISIIGMILILFVGAGIGTIIAHKETYHMTIDLGTKQVDFTPSIIFARENDVCYDKNKTQFVQIREIDWFNISCICSGFTNYYNDAKTTITNQILSFSYISENCVVVTQIDNFPFARYTGIGWKVKPYI